MTWTFHVPMQIWARNRLSLPPLSLPDVVILTDGWLKAPMGPLVVVVFVVLSITEVVFIGWGC